ALITAKTNVEGSKFGLEKAHLLLEQTQLRAPFEGIVTQVGCSVGDHLQGDKGLSPKLITVTRLNIVKLIVNIPERDILKTSVGTAAEVSIDAIPDEKITGKVSRVSAIVDPKLQTMRAEIDLPNSKNYFRPGMTGIVTVKLGKGPANALRIPSSALFSVGG